MSSYPCSALDSALLLGKAQLDATLSRNIASQAHLRRHFEKVPTELAMFLYSHPHLMSADAFARTAELVRRSLKVQQFWSATRTRNHALDTLQAEQRVLEQALSDLRRFISPIRRLPLEILQEILRFTLVADGSGTPPHGVNSPLRLMRVCRYWRDVAQDTPELWASLRLEHECGCRPDPVFPLADILRGWADRSRRSFALHLIAKYCHRLECKDVHSALSAVFVPQLKACAIKLTSLTLMDQPFESLTQLPAGLFSALETLTMSCHDFDHDSIILPTKMVAFKDSLNLRRLALGYSLMIHTCPSPYGSEDEVKQPPWITVEVFDMPWGSLTHLILQAINFAYPDDLNNTLSLCKRLQYLHIVNDPNNDCKDKADTSARPRHRGPLYRLDSLRVLSIDFSLNYDQAPEFLHYCEATKVETLRLCDVANMPPGLTDRFPNLRAFSYNHSYTTCVNYWPEFFEDLPRTVASLDIGAYRSGQYDGILSSLASLTRMARDSWSECLPEWQVLVLELADTQVSEEGPDDEDIWEPSDEALAAVHNPALCSSCNRYADPRWNVSAHPDEPTIALGEPVIDPDILIDLIRLRTVDAPTGSARLAKIIFYATHRDQVDLTILQNRYLVEILNFCATVQGLEVEARMIPGGRENKCVNSWSDRDADLEDWDGVQELLSLNLVPL